MDNIQKMKRLALLQAQNAKIKSGKISLLIAGTLLIIGIGIWSSIIIKGGLGCSGPVFFAVILTLITSSILLESIPILIKGKKASESLSKADPADLEQISQIAESVKEMVENEGHDTVVLYTRPRNMRHGVVNWGGQFMGDHLFLVKWIGPDISPVNILGKVNENKILHRDDIKIKNKGKCLLDKKHLYIHVEFIGEKWCEGYITPENWEKLNAWMSSQN